MRRIPPFLHIHRLSRKTHVHSIPPPRPLDLVQTAHGTALVIPLRLSSRTITESWRVGLRVSTFVLRYDQARMTHPSVQELDDGLDDVDLVRGAVD